MISIGKKKYFKINVWEIFYKEQKQEIIYAIKES